MLIDIDGDSFLDRVQNPSYVGGNNDNMFTVEFGDGLGFAVEGFGGGFGSEPEGDATLRRLGACGIERRRNRLRLVPGGQGFQADRSAQHR